MPFFPLPLKPSSLPFLSFFSVVLVVYISYVMSRASKLTFAGTGLATAGIVYFVHWAQEQEKAVRWEL